MTRFLRYAAIFIALALWVGGCFPQIKDTYESFGIVIDDYRYGDLYRLSNLPQFRDPERPCPPLPVQPDTSRTDLYIIGDSFTEPARLARAELPVARLTHVNWREASQIQLNPAHRNILLIETVERTMRQHLHEPIKQLMVVADTNRARPAGISWLDRLQKIYDQTRTPEAKLETVLFSQDGFLWLRERKAAFTQQAFARVDPKVRVSSDGQHILLGEDLDESGTTSGFVPVADAEIKTMVDSLNRVRERYLAQGFSAVYLSVIPNKTTVLAPTMGRYNHAIERLENHSDLQLPVVSVYADFKSAKTPIYALGDTHWNCTGRSIWLQKLREKLVEKSKQ
jgi:hypothetical protein